MLYLKPYVEDFKKLVCEILNTVAIIYVDYFQEAGYEFNIDGNIHTVYGTLACVSVDNPASASLEGFKESSSAIRPCQHCLTTKDEAESMVKFIINSI